MNNKEIYQMCLNERKVMQEQLKKEIDGLDIEIKKVSFEEHMYYRLAEIRHKYSEALENRREICDNKMKELESNINALKEELKLLEIEIEYIESLLA